MVNSKKKKRRSTRVKLTRVKLTRKNNFKRKSSRKKYTRKKYTRKKYTRKKYTKRKKSKKRKLMKGGSAGGGAAGGVGGDPRQDIINNIADIAATGYWVGVFNILEENGDIINAQPTGTWPVKSGWNRARLLTGGQRQSPLMSALHDKNIHVVLALFQMGADISGINKPELDQGFVNKVNLVTTTCRLPTPDETDKGKSLSGLVVVLDGGIPGVVGEVIKYNKATKFGMHDRPNSTHTICYQSSDQNHSKGRRLNLETGIPEGEYVGGNQQLNVKLTKGGIKDWLFYVGEIEGSRIARKIAATAEPAAVAAAAAEPAAAAAAAEPAAEPAAVAAAAAAAEPAAEPAAAEPAGAPATAPAAAVGQSAHLLGQQADAVFHRMLARSGEIDAAGSADAEPAAEPAAASEQINITVTDLDIKKHYYEISPDDTVESIMEQIFKERGDEFPVERQRLIKGGKQLDREITVAVAGIKNGDNLILVMGTA